MLKVGGSGHFEGEVNTRQLFVQEHITYKKYLKGPRIDVDTIRMDSTRGIFGHTKIFGDVQITQKLEVLGKTTLKGDLIAEKGFTFDGTNGLFYTPATATTGAVFKLGLNTILTNTSECLTPQNESGSNFYFPGNFVSYLPAGSSGTTGATNAAVRIGMVPWNGNAVIDVSGVGPTGIGTNGLEINSFCKRNTFINMGWDLRPNSFVDGGRVNLGAEVEMMRSLKIGYSGTDLIDSNAAIEINQNTDNAKGVNVKTWNNSIKAFAIEIPNGKNTFVVYGDGRTRIGGESINAGLHTDAILTVTGKMVTKSCYVTISNWADYVFDENYKLPNLYDVEKYYLANKHLPEIPTEKEVIENGIDVAEMNKLLLKKIEELTIMMVQQQKEIDALKAK